MSVLTAPSTVPTTTTTSSSRRTTVVAGLVGAAVTTAAAAVVHAAGVDFHVDGEAIPMLGFAQMTFLGALLGGLILALVNGRAVAPRRRFVQITVALTALSCIPSVALPDDAGAAVALVALHVLAAAIVVPPLARHARS